MSNTERLLIQPYGEVDTSVLYEFFDGFETLPEAKVVPEIPAVDTDSIGW